jgi:hypothetical protein
MKNEELIQLKITVSVDFGKNPSLQEFQDMLKALNEIYTYAIIKSQSEYEDLNIRYGLGQLIPHHELLISNVSRRNPFDFEFIVQLSQYGIAEFWTYLKLFFALCTKYNSVIDINLFVQQLLFWKDNKFPEFSNEKGEDFAKIRKKLLYKIGRIISDEKFRKYLDKICFGSAIIEELYSEVIETGFGEFFIKDKNFTGFE